MTRKVGRWILDRKGERTSDYHCSECNHYIGLCGRNMKQEQEDGYSLFCDGCGIKMGIEEE